MITESVQSTVSKKVYIQLSIFGLYIFLTFAGLSLSINSIDVVPLWTASGVAVVAILYVGISVWPAIWLGSLVIYFIYYLSNGVYPFNAFFTALGISAASVAQIFSFYYFAWRFNTDSNFLRKTKKAFSFVFASLISGFVFAVVVFITLFITVFNYKSLSPTTFLDWWFPDILSVLILTPLIVSILNHTKADVSSSRFFEVISLFILITLFFNLIFNKDFAIFLNDLLPLLIIPLMMWVAFRFSPREASIFILVITGISIAVTEMGIGPFVGHNENQPQLFLQIFLSVNAVITIALASSVTERRQTGRELAEISDSLEKRVVKRTSELATLNKEMLLEINQRKKAESALKESEERNKALLSSLPDLIFLFDQRGIFLDYQASNRDDFIGDPDKFLGKHIKDVFPGELANNLIETLGIVNQRGETITYEFHYEKNGAHRYYEARTSPCGQDKLMSVVRDISHKKQAEKALKESEDRLRFIFENVHDAIFTLNLKGRFFYISPAIERLITYNPDELFGVEFTRLVHSDDRSFVTGELNKIINSESTEITMTYRAVDRNDRIFWHTASITRNEDAAGNVIMIGLVRDITAMVKAEEENKRLEEQVRHAQKLESLGVLAGGIAHDFNNLLTAIMGNTGLAIMGVPAESKIKNQLENVEKASLRAADLCRQLLAYSGKGKFVVEALNINKLVKEMSHLLEVSISRKVELIYQFSDDVPSFEADATQIRQVVMNLITNASEAIGDKTGRIILRTGTMECDQKYLNTFFTDENLEEGKYIFIEVSDTGVGMSDETKSKIFDPFFTTKFTGRGLGLAAVLGIVRSHRGAINIESKPGTGTTFKILFPISEKIVIEQISIRKEIDTWKGSGTVLVVDDEEAIRKLGQNTLEQIGVKVLTAQDGKEAISIYKKHNKEINLVLMDMTMPHLNGDEAYRKIKRIRSDVKVILSSGYSEYEATQKFNNLGLSGFLQKPYNPTDLIAKVKAVMTNTAH